MRFCSIVILMLVCTVSLSQTSITWAKRFGGAANDDCQSFAIAQDGGFILAGYTTSGNSGDVGVTRGGADAFIVKTDASGNKQWVKTYGGSGDDVIKKIITTKDGGYILIGSTLSLSNDGDMPATYCNGTNGFRDVWIIKINAAGDLQWTKCYGGGWDDVGYSIIQTADNGYAFSGMTYSYDNDVSSTTPGSKVWLVKLDVDGNKIWDKTMYASNTGINAGYSLIQISGGGFVICGRQDNNLGDLLFIKTDMNGELVWQKTYDGNCSEQAFEIVQTDDDGFAVVGESNSAHGIFTTSHTPDGGPQEIAVVKLDASGNAQWTRMVGGLSAESGLSIARAKDGNLLICGFTLSNDGDITSNHGNQELCLFKLNIMNGEIVWGASFGGTSDDVGTQIIQHPDGSIFVAGYTKSNDYDAPGRLGGTDQWLLKISPADIALPLKLTNWSARYDKANSIVKLTWEITHESDLSSCAIERSRDGINFETLSSVAANNNQSLVTTYTYADNPLNAPFVYYRLKILNQSGSFEYSPILLVRIAGINITVYPNPASSSLNFSIAGGIVDNSKTLLQIYSADGKKISEREISANSYIMDISRFRRGIYLIKLSLKDVPWETKTIILK